MRSPFIFIYYFLAFVLIGLSGWIESSFDNPTIDQIIYHMYYSEGAAIKFGRIFAITFMAECIVFPIVFSAIATFTHRIIFRRFFQSSDDVLLSVQRTCTQVLQKTLFWSMPIAAVVMGTTILLLKLSVFSYIGYYFSEDQFSHNFANPNDVKLTKGKLKNLVLIYVESLEDTYGDTQLFDSDLLLPLRRLGGVHFQSYKPAAGATWTMGGIVATQCGVPLRVYSEYDFKRDSAQSRAFLPGATCLGDIFESFGYHNVFLGGAPLSFAGKGAFLKDHGYQTVYGRDEWEKAGVNSNEMSEWGLYDSALLENAKKQLRTLHASGQPFNLTILTLDTYNPRGFLSKHCRDHGASNFEGIVQCTSQQLADFVNFMSSSGYMIDTNIVIIGDHLAVPNPVFDKLKLAPERHIFNLFISDSPLKKNTEVILPFDIFPTIIELSGINVDGDRLGLGYSGFFEQEVPRPTHRLEELTLPSIGGSASYNRLWRPVKK